MDAEEGKPSEPVRDALEVRLSRLEQGAPLPGQTPRYPTGWAIRTERLRIRREERQRIAEEREEAALGLPAQQAAWEQAQAAVEGRYREALEAAKAACRVAEQSAVESRESARAELGARPSLELHVRRAA